MSYKPRQGSSYWMINSRFDVKQTQNTGSQKAIDRIKVGNCFKTAKEAKHFRTLVMRLATTQKLPPILMSGKFDAIQKPIPWWRFW